jgi:hypothetical protein
MILPRYRIADSLIAGAGKGLFLAEPVQKGAIVTAPDQVDRMMPGHELEKYPKDSMENISSARWFENWYSISTDWPDECYVNHSNHPTGVWHLGFIFAARDLPADTEITADYRFILGSGEISGFLDSETGQEIVGLEWRENLRQSALKLLDLI